MPSPRTQTLGIDLSLGVAALVFGSLAGGIPLTGAGVLIAGLGTVVFVGALFVAERFTVVAVVDKNRPASLILTGVTFVSLGAALSVGRAFIVSPSATLLWGSGFGLCAYRGVFGVVYPVPNRRLRQARQWGKPPEDEMAGEFAESPDDGPFPEPEDGEESRE